MENVVTQEGLTLNIKEVMYNGRRLVFAIINTANKKYLCVKNQPPMLEHKTFQKEFAPHIGPQAGPYPHLVSIPSKMSVSRLHEIFEGEKRANVGLNEAAIRKYIQEQESHDIALDSCGTLPKWKFLLRYREKVCLPLGRNEKSAFC